MLITTETAWGETDTHLSLKHPLLNAHGTQLCTTSMDLKTHRQLLSECDQYGYPVQRDDQR